MDQVLDAVLVELDPSPAKQNLIAGVHDGQPLHGSGVVRPWQVRAAAYPEPLATAVIRRNAQVDHFWRWEMLAQRQNNRMLIYQSFSQVQQQMLHVLLGLNRVYYCGFKWLDVVAARLPIAPPALCERLAAAYSGHVSEDAQHVALLVEETYDLLARHECPVDVDRLRQVFRYQRPVWHEPPPVT